MKVLHSPNGLFAVSCQTPKFVPGVRGLDVFSPVDYYENERFKTEGFIESSLDKQYKLFIACPGPDWVFADPEYEYWRVKVFVDGIYVNRRDTQGYKAGERPCWSTSFKGAMTEKGVKPFFFTDPYFDNRTTFSHRSLNRLGTIRVTFHRLQIRPDSENPWNDTPPKMRHGSGPLGVGLVPDETQEWLGATTRFGEPEPFVVPLTEQYGEASATHANQRPENRLRRWVHPEDVLVPYYELKLRYTSKAVLLKKGIYVEPYLNGNPNFVKAASTSSTSGPSDSGYGGSI